MFFKKKPEQEKKASDIEEIKKAVLPPAPAPKEEAPAEKPEEAPEEALSEAAPEVLATLDLLAVPKVEEIEKEIKEREEKPRRLTAIPLPEAGEAYIRSNQPELLRAFVDVLGNENAVEIIDILRYGELSLSDLLEKTKFDEDEAKSILHKLVCLGFITVNWYQAPSGRHLRKYKLEHSRGKVEFDIVALKDTLTAEELKSKSTKLVAIVTSEGRVPKSLLVKVLALKDESQLEQVLRYTEKFELPDIRSMLTIEAKLLKEPKILKAEEVEEGAKIKDLYKEIEEIEKSFED